jgi:hypothetical protein
MTVGVDLVHYRGRFTRCGVSSPPSCSEPLRGVDGSGAVGNAARWWGIARGPCRGGPGHTRSMDAACQPTSAARERAAWLQGSQVALPAGTMPITLKVRYRAAGSPQRMPVWPSACRCVLPLLVVRVVGT